MSTSFRPHRRALRLALALALAACAHAQPANGNRDPNAPIDPDYPEQNCHVNNTVDCMPASGGI